MKKFLSAILMVAMSVCAQAQIVSSSSSRVVRVVEKPVVKETPTKPSTPFDVSHYVIWTPNMIYNMSNSGKELLYGFFSSNLMYGMNIPFWQQEGKNGWEGTYSCLYWGFEAGITTRKFDMGSDFPKNGGENRWPTYEKIKRTGLQIAPKVGFKWGDPDDGFGTIAMGIELGLYANYNIGNSYLLGEDYYSKDFSPATSDLLMSAFFDAWNKLETGISVEAIFTLGPVRLGLGYVGGLAPSFSGIGCKPVAGYYIPPMSATYHCLLYTLGVEF